MVNKINREEGATISYDGTHITIRGDDFSVTALVSTSELMGIYMNGKGNAKVKLTVDLPEDPKPVPVVKENTPAPVVEASAPEPVFHVNRRKVKTLEEVQHELNVDFENNHNKNGGQSLQPLGVLRSIATLCITIAAAADTFNDLRTPI